MSRFYWRGAAGLIISIESMARDFYFVDYQIDNVANTRGLWCDDIINIWCQ